MKLFWITSFLLLVGCATNEVSVNPLNHGAPSPPRSYGCDRPSQASASFSVSDEEYQSAVEGTYLKKVRQGVDPGRARTEAEEETACRFPTTFQVDPNHP